MDRDNIQLDTRRGTPRSLSFAHDGNHSSFPAAILGPSVEVPSQSGVDSLYPGIPMDPSELNESIRESSVRLKRLTLEFAEGPNGKWPSQIVVSRVQQADANINGQAEQIC